MAEPSNIRVNPFTSTGGATNYVELTEKHIIPANSPYVIRLNEVPEKQDPSNMKMVYVDSATGAATENTLTEVAATPGQGEFRPDYSTNALDDKTWNTGLIEFSASDAGKIVQVTYTGTGTLAGVNSNHWPSWYTDRGDGSDGDFVPTENTTISGVKNYKSVFIKEGVTVTINPYVYIRCQGAFVNEGVITADAKGMPGGKGGIGSSSSSTPGVNGGAGNGGAGGNSAGGAGYYIDGFNYGKEMIKVVDYTPYVLLGASGGGGGQGGSTKQGGDGGNGGGCIYIMASEVNNIGNITAKGGNGGAGIGSNSTGGGGGGGGAIIAIANRITGKETMDVSGGIQGGSAVNGEIGIIKIIELGE